MKSGESQAKVGREIGAADSTLHGWLKEETILTRWTPEDGIPTLRKLPYAAGLRYTVQTARYHTRRKTVYLRYGV